MTVLFVVYDTATGAIKRTGAASDTEAANAQAGAGESVLLDCSADDLCQKVVAGAVVPI